MTGGILQLVAYGIEDIFITKDPQITFFKIVYRRHTNFSTEPIPRFFIHNPDFGKRTTCIISKNGDLVGGMTLVLTLPKIKPFTTSLGEDTITKIAWVKRIGYAIIKSIEVEINGRTIDRHFGEWLYLWTEIFGPKDRSIDHMIGDIPEVTDFTNGKDAYTLFVPLKFWFCRSSGLALPLISLQYSDVKINLELNEQEECYIITPSHYINCEADLVNFAPYEYIEQTISDTDVRIGMFTHYDIVTKRLYYLKISPEKISGIPTSITKPSLAEKLEILADPANKVYQIVGKTTNFIIMPGINETSKPHLHSDIRNLSIPECYLLVDYIYLDSDERLKFSQAKHDYIIEQLFQTPDIVLQGANRTTKMIVDQPCKLMVWVVQMDYIKNSNDHFNYTDTYQRKNDAKGRKMNTLGKSIVLEETILLNGQERVSMRSFDYFNYVQAHQYANFSPAIGINMYSYAFNPANILPSGSCNMSQIEKIDTTLKLSFSVSILNPAKFRGYSLSHNVLRIANGLAAVIFTR